MPHLHLPDVVVTKCGTAARQDILWITAVYPRPTQKQSVPGQILLDILGLIDVLTQRMMHMLYIQNWFNNMFRNQSLT
jgi:hypothetical protein